MTKIISILVCLLMLFACVSVSAQEPISVELDAYKLEFDTTPVNIDGKVLVPVRAIFEAMGAEVLWDNETRTVTSTLDETTVVMTIDNPIMTVNGKEINLLVPPKIIDDRTLVPAREAAESFGANVSWNGDDNTVEIFTKEFYEREKSVLAQKFSKILSEDEQIKSDFTISYYPEYSIKTDANDGTDFEIASASEEYSVILSVRADLYVGPEISVTDDYAESVAQGMADAVYGTLVSTDIETIGTEEFIEISYNYPYSVHEVNDNLAEVLVYTGIKDGVVYTMTYTHYGNVPDNISADINYMMNSLVIN